MDFPISAFCSKSMSGTTSLVALIYTGPLYSIAIFIACFNSFTFEGTKIFEGDYS